MAMAEREIADQGDFDECHRHELVTPFTPHALAPARPRLPRFRARCLLGAASLCLYGLD